MDHQFASDSRDARELLLVRMGEQRAFWFFSEPRDGDLAIPTFSVDASRSDDGWVIDVTSDVLARDIVLAIDRVDPDAVVSDGLVTLLAGETAHFVVRGATSASVAAFADPAVLRSANDLVQGRKR